MVRATAAALFAYVTRLRANGIECFRCEETITTGTKHAVKQEHNYMELDVSESAHASTSRPHCVVCATIALRSSSCTKNQEKKILYNIIGFNHDSRNIRYTNKPREQHSYTGSAFLACARAYTSAHFQSFPIQMRYIVAAAAAAANERL